jgi:hypothetical protein
MRQELVQWGVQVIEKMERETGLEPATSSLGTCNVVVNDKVHISRAGERQGERTGVLAARLM